MARRTAGGSSSALTTNSRSVASPTQSRRRHTTAFDALAHDTTSFVRHRCSCRHPPFSRDAGGTIAATLARSLRAPMFAPAPANDPKVSPDRSAMAITSALANASNCGTLAAPFPLESLCAPEPRLRFTPKRSGYAIARSTPASSTPSPSKKGNTGPDGSPDPTPPAKRVPVFLESSSANRFSAFSSCSATFPASRAALRSTSPVSYAENGDDVFPSCAFAFASFTAALAPPPAGRPLGAPRMLLRFFPPPTFVPMGTLVGALGEDTPFSDSESMSSAGMMGKPITNDPPFPSQSQSAPTRVRTSTGASRPLSKSRSPSTAAS
mmetsp:Transcript_334/g.1312  ORF Transcript_334/g.1312 Transcript_334/m.1312 type:complete len:323 (-) Transcript_334:1633-2601(-)